MTDVSPEVLNRLAELIKATGGSSTPSSRPTLLEYLKGVTEFIGAVAWPAAAIICVVLFRYQLMEFIGDVQTVKLFGAEISRKIHSELEQSAEEAKAKTGMSLAPSAGELSRGKVVKKLAADVDIAVVRRSAEDLAREYEQVRSFMLPGDERTRAMEIVIAKMRTIGQAFFPIRYEFVDSASPGRRLMVIAALQVEPDYDLLNWLADRVGSERPFLQFHALAAISLAVRAGNAKFYLPAIEAAVEKVRQFKASFGDDPSRVRILAEIEEALKSLKASSIAR